ncbi:MAG: aminoglycoside phosphotransferase family protein [Oscillospiraceae bacterium]|nr:aminoglycoside phosphotransferase family protein [Oscillospiraceae bacterium]
MSNTMNEISFLLKSKYKIISDSIFPAKGGFSAKAAYRVVSSDGIEYFVKVYDKFLPTTRFFVERIDLYMPVLDWLSTTPALHGRILTPISTFDGLYKAETDNDVYTVFLFVGGDAPGVHGMTKKQTAELAETLARLHDTGDDVPFEMPGLSEDISLSFCEQLVWYLSKADTKNDKLYNFVSPYADMLIKASREALSLRDTIRTGYSPIVLCHGDAHGNNVIQGEQLVLADWEDLRWAPAEADLFIHAWHKHSNTFLEAYAIARRGYFINKELLCFYTLRRRIEDVWVDMQRLIEESPDETERAKSLAWITEGIEEIQKLII